ncbi:MAG: DUF1579 family protein [Gemmatimonadaceae bacterium]
MIPTKLLFLAAVATNAAFGRDTRSIPTFEREHSPAVVAADPEHDRLTAMVGTWDVEMTLWIRPGAPPLTVKAASIIRSLFDGLFIEERIEGAIGKTAFSTLAWTGYNADSHQYEATRISSTNPNRIAEAGVWNEQAKQFELKGTYLQAGEPWTQRTVIRQSSADAMVATSYLSFGKIPEWKAVEIRYVRKK